MNVKVAIVTLVLLLTTAGEKDCVRLVLRTVETKEVGVLCCPGRAVFFVGDQVTANLTRHNLCESVLVPPAVNRIVRWGLCPFYVWIAALVAITA